MSLSVIATELGNWQLIWWFMRCPVFQADNLSDTDTRYCIRLRLSLYFASSYPTLVRHLQLIWHVTKRQLSTRCCTFDKAPMRNASEERKGSGVSSVFSSDLRNVALKMGSERRTNYLTSENFGHACMMNKNQQFHIHQISESIRHLFRKTCMLHFNLKA